MIFIKKSEIEDSDYHEYLFSRNELTPRIEELVSDINGYLKVEAGLSQAIVKGTLTYRLKLICSRCAEEFERIRKEYATLIISREVFEENFITEDVLKNYFEKHIIDLTQWIYDTILLSIPTKTLCKEDCKGLCPVCGTNLNLYTCNCKNEKKEIDPRWAPLLKIKEKKRR